MDFFNSKREKKYGKRAGLLSHKNASKSNPSSPPHPAESRSPQVSYFGIRRSESEYAFPISDEETTHWKHDTGMGEECESTVESLAVRVVRVCWSGG